MPDAIKGVTFKYDRARAMPVAMVDPDFPFWPVHLWWLQDRMDQLKQAYCEIRVENSQLRLEFPAYGVPDDQLMQLVAQALPEGIEDRPYAPVKPIAMYRREGEAALNPTEAITANRLSEYMDGLQEAHKIKSKWRAKLDNFGYLKVWFDTYPWEIDRAVEIFDPTFAGTCTISFRAYGVEPGTLYHTLEYGGSFPLKIGRAESLGFWGVGNQGSGHRVAAFGARAKHPSVAIKPNFDQAIVFAQSLGCHPIGDLTVHLDHYTRLMRRIGPIGDWVSGFPQ